MDAIISLCHFCELHGPVVLFCTQVIDHHQHHLESDEDSFAASDIKIKKDISNENFDNNNNNNNNNLNLKLNSHCSAKDEMFHDKVNIEVSDCFRKCTNAFKKHCSSRQIHKCCEACQAFSNSTSGFISIESASSASYITRHHSPIKSINSLIKQACIRSISCEHCPGQSGAFFYGDDSGLNVLCYKFFLKDFHSRGFKRSYCINLQAQDKIYLLNSWRFLTKNLEIMVNRLKQEAENKFNIEHAEHGSVLRCRSPLSSSSASSLVSSSAACLQQPTTTATTNYHESSINNKQIRSLLDITGNSDIFKELHLMFVWLLESYKNRVVVLDGGKGQNSTIGDSNGSRDNDEKFIDLNRQEETEEGFVKLFCFKKSETLTNLSPSSQQQCNNKNDEEDDDDDDEDMAVFTHPRDLLKVLGLSMFSELLHHILIGHQLVVRARDRPIITSIIDCLVKFLPEKTTKINYYTTDYLKNCDHHFIGMSLLPLPPPTNIRPYVLLDVSGIHTLKKVSQFDRCSIAKCYESSKLQIEELMLRYYMLTTDKLQLPAKSPTILENILKILMNESLDNSVVDLCLLSMKEDWLNKSSIYQLHLCTGEQKSKLDENRFLQIINAKEEDKTLLKYWAHAF